jgi:hypothetical protein
MHGKQQAWTGKRDIRLCVLLDKLYSEQGSNVMRNPRRVHAGKANRTKRGRTTLQGFERLRKAALTHQPWTKSTGPTSEAGKAISSRNGSQRQLGPWSARAVRRMLKDLNHALDQLIQQQAIMGLVRGTKELS